MQFHTIVLMGMHLDLLDVVIGNTRLECSLGVLNVLNLGQNNKESEILWGNLPGLKLFLDFDLKFSNFFESYGQNYRH